MSPRSGPPSQQRRHQQGGGSAPMQLFFDPDKPEVELYDHLAEQQADAMPGDNGWGGINSNQLRKYFGEIKGLYLQYQAMAGQQPAGEYYIQSIEPRFKMIRSKVSYGKRAGGQGKLSKEFADLIDLGIQKVRPGNNADFEKFVMHLEAVVGFMYGKGKIKQ